MAAMAQLKAGASSAQTQLSVQRPFTSFRISRGAVRVSASAERSGVEASRRQVLQLAAIPALSGVLPSAALAAGNKPPRGFNPVQDLTDNYQFLYPFGWQEVTIDGADVVYKDVVEPLESVSVTLTPTDKADIKEFGSIQEVAETLAKEVLTAPGQEVQVLSTNERETKDRIYYEFEFTAKNSRYTRHSVAVVIAYKGTFFTLTTGANERRWGKMKDKLNTMVRSFQLIN
ncbi:MAG: chloroplast oxygen-evolving complex/thylakoid lumenal 25.6kDa protein [Monoraphidium minutum]|nr:MAG: chloroplast oxygen-evolving complex/thylakoid lumenal 25.6kDa protein [Monoraphidium minutum]